MPGVMNQSFWMWASFAAVIIGLLVFDLGVKNRKEHEIGMKESLISSVCYISVGLLFGAWVWFELGPTKAAEYFTGFVVEESLSIDNVFVIAMLFTFFNIPRRSQHRVLFWGILGAIVMRGLMIGLGAALISRFEWILTVFAVFLILTGLKMLLAKDKPSDLEQNIILKFMRKHFRVTKTLQDNHFFVRLPVNPGSTKNAIWMTPLFVSLVMIEFADVLFAVDSVPAIFMVTKDPMIVYTSNIFAIMGLRSLYFVLAAVIERFHYLKYALSVLLIFIGSKGFIADFMQLEKFPIGWSLGITFGILASGILVSVIKTGQTKQTTRS